MLRLCWTNEKAPANRQGLSLTEPQSAQAQSSLASSCSTTFFGSGM